MSKIKIILNGEEKEFNEKLTISELIQNFELDAKKIAIELNLEIIDPKFYKSKFLQNNDKLEIVHFIGGG